MRADFHYISVQEVEFIRAYALTLKKHFSELCSALYLMRTDVGVKCPMRAAALARNLQEFQVDFEHALASIADKHGLAVKKLADFPGVDELAPLIQISFFSLSDVKPSAKIEGYSGWYSGHPLSWETVWEKEHYKHAAAPETGQPTTAILNAFFKLLGFSGKINHAQSFPYKKFPPPKMHQDYEDDYDEEDDEPDYNDED